VLIAIPNDNQAVRIGIAAGRSVGNAVKRNRGKRLIRASVDAMLAEITSGWDIVILAREPVISATFVQTKEALHSLFKRARLIKVGNVC